MEEQKGHPADGPIRPESKHKVYYRLHEDIYPILGFAMN